MSSAVTSTNGASGPAQSPVAPYCVPATASLQERRPRTLKHGDTFAVFDHNGDAISGHGSPEGLFHRDTRYLSHLYLTINGHRPMLLSSTLRDDNATLTCDLTNPDIPDEKGKLILGHDLIHIRRTRLLWNRCCHERLAVRNYDDRRQQVRIEIAFGADFADLFEVRGTVRARKGRHLRAVIERESILLSYTGSITGSDPPVCPSIHHPTTCAAILSCMIWILSHMRQDRSSCKLPATRARATQAIVLSSWRCAMPAARCAPLARVQCLWRHPTRSSTKWSIAVFRTSTC